MRFLTDDLFCPLERMTRQLKIPLLARYAKTVVYRVKNVPKIMEIPMFTQIINMLIIAIIPKILAFQEGVITVAVLTTPERPAGLSLLYF